MGLAMDIDDIQFLSRILVLVYTSREVDIVLPSAIGNVRVAPRNHHRAGHRYEELAERNDHDIVLDDRDIIGEILLIEEFAQIDGDLLAAALDVGVHEIRNGGKLGPEFLRRLAQHLAGMEGIGNPLRG